MIDFDATWEKFDYIIDEMKDGMAFFEGYILSASRRQFKQGFLSFSQSIVPGFYGDYIWSEESSVEKLSNPNRTLELYDQKRIVGLNWGYDCVTPNDTLRMRILDSSSGEGNRLDVEMICLREPILSSENPKEAVRLACAEFLRLKVLFGGTAVFIGPDTLTYPENENEYPDYWIRLDTKQDVRS